MSLQPVVPVPAPLWFHILYYCVFMPAALVGNLLTCLTVGRRLLHVSSVPCVLVGGLALNDFLTCLTVFLPSIAAEINRGWPDWPHFCRFHTVTSVWYLYTTFAIVVLMSVDRWLAIIHPYYYVRAVTTLQMKLVVGALGLFCLLLGSLPLIWFPVSLRPGWYCTVTVHHVINGTVHTQVPPLYISITTTYLGVGMVIMTAFTAHIIIHLNLKKDLAGGQKRTVERKFAKLMGVVGGIFLATWIPSLVSMFLCLYRVEDLMCHRSQYWASRVVNMSVAINPIVYGVMKKAYRRGYVYWLRLGAYVLSCTLLPRPTDGDVVFGKRPFPGLCYHDDVSTRAGRSHRAGSSTTATTSSHDHPTTKAHDSLLVHKTGNRNGSRNPTAHHQTPDPLKSETCDNCISALQEI